MRVHQNPLEGLLKHILLGPPQEFDSRALGLGLRMWISNTLPRDAEAAGPENPPETHG